MQLLSFGHAVVLRADVPCAGAWRVPVLARAVRHATMYTARPWTIPAVRRLLYCRGVKRFNKVSTHQWACCDAPAGTCLTAVLDIILQALSAVMRRPAHAFKQLCPGTATACGLDGAQ